MTSTYEHDANTYTVSGTASGRRRDKDREKQVRTVACVCFVCVCVCYCPIYSGRQSTPVGPTSRGHTGGRLTQTRQYGARREKIYFRVLISKGGPCPKRKRRKTMCVVIRRILDATRYLSVNRWAHLWGLVAQEGGQLKGVFSVFCVFFSRAKGI